MDELIDVTAFGLATERLGPKETLAAARTRRHLALVAEDELGIYRGEVRATMLALAEIIGQADRILGYIEGDDGEEEIGP